MTTRPALAAIEAEQRRIKQAADRALSEREWQAKVVKAAEAFGWRCYHVPDSRRVTSPGFPDLVLARPDGKGGARAICVELKTEGGRMRPDQWIWIGLLRAAGMRCEVWRPRDWDRVLEELR